MVAALLLVGSLPPLKADNDGAPAGKPVRGEKRIKEAVESGKITKEEARERLEAMRKAAGANRAKAAGGGMTIEDYRRGEARIKAAVQAGQISREDAEKRLMEMRKAMGASKWAGGPEGRGPAQAGGAEAEIMKRKLQAAQKKVRAAVEAGNISEEEGRKKIMEIGEKIHGGGQGPASEAARKKQYQDVEKKVWEAVKEGRISKQEGEKRLFLLEKKFVYADRWGNSQAFQSLRKVIFLKKTGGMHISTQDDSQEFT